MICCPKRAKRPVAASLLSAGVLIWSACGGHAGSEVEKLTYANPPERLVWLEGEDCTDHNWVPGAMTNCWWYEYAGITGRGLFDLASWRLPDDGEYRATYEFELPDAGEYVLYYRGRHPGHQASPIFWQIDEQPECRQPPEGKHPNTNLLGHEMNWKVVLIRLGTFRADAGRHSVTIKVRDFVEDRGQKYVSQGIDSLLIGRTEIVELPERKIVQDFADGVEAPSGGPGGKAFRFEAQADPEAPEHKGQHVAPGWTDWSAYDRLQLWVRVEGEGEHYDGKLRCYYQGPKFVDLPVHVPGRELGAWKELTYDLSAQFEGVSRAAIHSMWLYTYGKWYTRPAKLTVHVGGVELTAPNAEAAGGVPAPVRGAAPPEQVRRATLKLTDDWVWNAAGDDGGLQRLPAVPDDPRQESEVIEAGALTAAISPVHGGIRRLRFGAGNTRLILVRERAPAVVRMEFLSGRVWQPPKPGGVRVGPDGLVFEQSDDAVALRVLFEPVPDKDELSLTLTIRNLSREPVCSVVLAPLAGVGLGGDVEGDTLLVGSRRFAAGELGERHRLVSPQQFTHDWVCLHDGQTAFHLRWEDPDVLDTEAVFGRAEGSGYLVLRKFPRIKPGAEWQAPTLVIGADSTGNWHEAADRFSRWWHSWAKRPFIPDWLKSAGGLAVAYGVLSEDAVDKNRETLAKMRALDGIFWGHTSGWLPLQTEGWYPHGYRLADEQLGQFRRATDALRADGGRMSVYSNPLMFSRVIRDYDEYGHDLATIAHDGNVWLTEHTHRHHPMALPYPNAKWARHFLDAIEPAVVRGKPDALYMDQLGAVPTHLDFAPDKHDHQHYGEWVAGQVEFAREVHQHLRRKRPDLVTLIECPSPAVQQYVTLGFLMYGAHDIFRTTFPHYPNAVGHYTGGVDAAQGLAFAAEAFLTGQPVLLFTGAVEKMEETTRRRIRELIVFKQKVDPVLYRARYRATRGLTVPQGVMASCFVENGGGVLVPFVNRADSEARIRVGFEALGVRVRRSARVITPVDPDGSAVPVEAEAGALAVAVPGDSFGIVQFYGP